MSIVGNGDIAKVLKDKGGITYFASGVSNSSETRVREFMRELLLLSEQTKFKRLVYFSSLCVFYSDTPYAEHKRSMELAVKSGFPNYTIVRLGNITWGNNPHTIINFFKNKIKKGEPFEIRDEYRYIVGKKQFLHWMDLIPDFNCEMNIPGKMMKVRDIVANINLGKL
jgi:hypothetical protein